MNELTDVQQDGTEVTANAETSPVETTSEATTGQDTGTEQTGQADDAGEATEEAHTKRVPWFQKRIDEVTAKKYDAEREAAYWRGIAEGRTPQAPQQQELSPPDRWEDPEGHDRWLIEQAKQAAREDLARQQNVRTYEDRVATVRGAKPDFDSVALNPSLPVTKDMAQVIFESEKGPEILYHLGSNPSEADRIARLPTYLQAKELGRIEATLGNVPHQPTRNPPPPPPKTVNGLSAGLAKDPSEMSMAEYVAARKAGTV